MLSIEPLGDEHQLDDFDCGDTELNTWLIDSARASHTAGHARVYVLVASDSAEVLGYYAVCASSVERTNATGRIRRNAPDPIPAILIGRLAVRSNRHRQGLGSALMKDAVLRAIQAAELIGARCLLVHAKDDSAAAFYKRFDFSESPTDSLNLQIAMHDLKNAAAG